MPRATRDDMASAVNAVAVAIDIIFATATVTFPPALSIGRGRTYDSTTGSTDRRAFGNAKPGHDRTCYRTTDCADACTPQSIARRFTRTAANAGSGCQSCHQ
ncbi:hypothetical protein TomTYG75_23000 [Sphingobium sp. TomTYG75]